MSKKPVIGLPTSAQWLSPGGAGPRRMTGLNHAYLKLVAEAGCVPIVLSCNSLDPQADAERLIDLLDGLILIGGEDIHPQRYDQPLAVRYDEGLRGPGQRGHRPAGFGPDLVRDEFEFLLYQLAKQRGLPIFGICRGLQLINIAEGGTLYQETPASQVEHFMHEDGWIPYHSVSLPPGTFSHSVMQVDNYMACSLHHQSIERLAAPLVATSIAEDGIIESLEWIDEQHFMLAVQGHIEHMAANLHAYQKLLQAYFAKVIERTSHAHR